MSPTTPQRTPARLARLAGPLLVGLSVAACSSPSRQVDPAVAALRACVERAPGRVCARPVVPALGGEVLADSAYWADARAEVFHDAVGLCGRASLDGAHVGSPAGVGAVRQAQAKAKLEALTAGQAPPDDEPDLGICRDVLVVFAGSLSDGVPDLGGRLTEQETREVANTARGFAMRERARATIDAWGSR